MSVESSSSSHPSSSPPVVNAVHAASNVGFGMAANSDYNKKRPSYTDETVDYILRATVLDRLESDMLTDDALPSSAPRTPRTYRLIDLGSGTGIFTRLIHARLSAYVAAHSDALASRGVRFELIAIDPNDGMRARFVEHNPWYSVVNPEGRIDTTLIDGTGSSMPFVNSGTIHAVFAVSSFHWFASESSLAELARILVPSSASSASGAFVPIWNRTQDTAPWMVELHALFKPMFVGVPQRTSGEWERIIDGAESPFVREEAKTWVASAVEKGDKHMLYGRISTLSAIAASSEEVRNDLKRRILELLATHPDTKDKVEFELVNDADAYIYRLKK